MSFQILNPHCDTVNLSIFRQLSHTLVFAFPSGCFLRGAFYTNAKETSIPIHLTTETPNFDCLNAHQQLASGIKITPNVLTMEYVIATTTNRTQQTAATAAVAITTITLWCDK
ncbi:unnamed protein product [Ceratitis capitata]|uniref:(Mediterranean fruit fly) hypothetical protein n=1 Tax=Ceratitis capitata TaxID=7213 RepID=A0A811V4U9_CERCA|nr:unnamed protein product [Ceratitis capitata]